MTKAEPTGLARVFLLGGFCWGLVSIGTCPHLCSRRLIRQSLGAEELEGWGTERSSADLWVSLKTPRQEMNSKASVQKHRKVQGGTLVRRSRALGQVPKGGETEGNIPGRRVGNSPGFAGQGSLASTVTPGTQVACGLDYEHSVRGLGHEA